MCDHANDAVINPFYSKFSQKNINSKFCILTFVAGKCYNGYANKNNEYKINPGSPTTSGVWLERTVNHVQA